MTFYLGTDNRRELPYLVEHIGSSGRRQFVHFQDINDSLVWQTMCQNIRDVMDDIDATLNREHPTNPTEAIERYNNALRAQWLPLIDALMNHYERDIVPMDIRASCNDVRQALSMPPIPFVVRFL